MNSYFTFNVLRCLSYFLNFKIHFSLSKSIILRPNKLTSTCQTVPEYSTAGVLKGMKTSDMRQDTLGNRRVIINISAGHFDQKSVSQFSLRILLDFSDPNKDGSS